MDTLILGFLKDLETFGYDLSCLDHVWHILFPDRLGRWQRLHVNKYDKAFQIGHHDHDNGILQVDERGAFKIADLYGNEIYKPGVEDTWRDLIADAHAWLQIVRRDWVKAAKHVISDYPLAYRKGIVPHAVVRDAMPDLYPLYRELGVQKCRKMVKLVEDGFFWRSKNTWVSTMTANRYFEYCRIAYLASARKNEGVDALLSGREMYKKYADGRHEGLLDLDSDSEVDFAEWLDNNDPAKPRFGGHPWEIRRGGNTTHIDLSVSRPYPNSTNEFIVELRGESFTRMAETIKMCLAVQAAGLPISIANSEDVRKRILGQDNLGVIPSYGSAHRAHQHFPKEQCVYDVIYLKELGRFKRRIVPFISWEPLPLLRPLK